MTRLLGLLICAAAVGLSGCASMQPPQHILAYDEVKLGEAEGWQVGLDYYKARKGQAGAYAVSGYHYHPPTFTAEAISQLEAELRKHGLTEEHLEKVRKGIFSIGMPEAGLYAAWGQPREINRTVSEYGVRKQYIYGRFPDSTYVYSQDGVITSFQD